MSEKSVGALWAPASLFAMNADGVLVGRTARMRTIPDTTGMAACCADLIPPWSRPWPGCCN